MNIRSKWALALLVTAGAALLPAAPAQAVSTTSTYIQLFTNQPEAFVNGEKVVLESPVQQIDDSVYVPLKWLGDRLGMQVEWNGQTGKVQVPTPKAYIEFDLSGGQASINNQTIPLGKVARIDNGRLFVKLTWFAEYAQMQTKYFAGQQRTDIVYIESPVPVYKESAQSGEDLPNSRPVAKFMFGKQSYRLGEPVDYIDLSYDPDAEGLPKIEWGGRQDAFFKPGDYTVTLKVTDPKGNVSDEFARTIHIEDKPYLDPFHYGLEYDPLGSMLKDDWGVKGAKLTELPTLAKQVHQYEERPLISVVTRGDAMTPAPRGFYYQETVNGKARLYVSHVNRGKGKEKLGIVIRNKSDSKPLNVKTTRLGETVPTLFAQQLAPHAAADFLLRHAEDRMLTVKPQEAAFYKTFGDLGPGQGIEAIYDVETDGEAAVSVIAMEPDETVYDLGKYTMLEGKTKLRGTFPASDILWNVDASSFKSVSRLTIGEDVTDKLLTGRDAASGQTVASPSGSGVAYTIRLDRPRKAALVLVPRGGYFQGPVKIGGEIVTLPQKGALTPLDGGVLLYRTTGAEPYVEIEWMSSSGSLLPVDLILYPLEHKE